MDVRLTYKGDVMLLGNHTMQHTIAEWSKHRQLAIDPATCQCAEVVAERLERKRAYYEVRADYLGGW